jgi:uncharacterized membrane protein
LTRIIVFEPGQADQPQQIERALALFRSRAAADFRSDDGDLNEITSRIKVLRDQDVDLVDRPIPSAQMIPDGVAYLPQAIAFEIARFAGASFVPTLWAARLGVLLASVLITVLALELMPAWARWTSVAVSLLPMAAYLRGSASPDAIVTAMTLLGIAAFLDGARRNALNVAWSSSVIALAVCLYLAAVKPPYACILLLGLLWLPLGLRRHSHPRIMIVIVTMMWVATLAVAAWHSKDVASFTASIRPDVTPAEIAAADKLQMLLTSPLAVGAVFARTLLAAPGMVYSTIARFGWSDINPTPLFHALVILWCASVVYLDRHPIIKNVSLNCGTIMLATFAAQVALVALTIWLAWTETASPMIQGLQGRYFLPALICGVLGAAAFLFHPFVTSSAAEHQVSARLLPYFVTGGAVLMLALSATFVVLGEFFAVQGFHVICLHDLCNPN